MNETLSALYKEVFGAVPAKVETLPGAGSNRVYVRFTAADETTCIGAFGNDLEENRSFLYLARHFSSKGLPVPQVHAILLPQPPEKLGLQAPATMPG